MAHLSWPRPNINWIGEVCDTLGKISLTSLDRNHWATAGFRMNLSSVKGGIRSNPLFLLEGNTILPMTPTTGCELLLSPQHGD